ncbi:hypothetical protein RR47_GL002181 [Enterococcus columbae DSM 7374 = ATCC 51263]|nr:hypothetical protein RR47_GL002181 [Enterococcus columbae DSM 7374 = ATCC 51263]
MKQMNISQVAENFDLTPATLRYYEKIGLIPDIQRKNGVRNYNAQDLDWIEFIKCMRSAGLSIESLIDYTRLYHEGPQTADERMKILIKERELLFERYQELKDTLERLDEKIDKYRRGEFSK